MAKQQIKHGANTKEISIKYGIKQTDIIDFSSNINPNIPSNLEQMLIKALKKANSYPDINYKELRESISDYLNIDSLNIIVGNGASEIIYLLAKGLGKRGAVLNPTFSEYKRALNVANKEVISIYRDKDFKIDMQNIEQKIDEFDFLYICNPNNPTSSLDDLKDLAKYFMGKDKILIVDETFMEFCQDDKKTLLPFVKTHKNLIIIKAITKFFGLPGIRVGYGISSNIELLNKLWSIKEPWSVNTFGEDICKKVLKDKTYIKKSKEFYAEQINYLYNELRKLPNFKAYEPNTNFILMKSKVLKASEIKEKLLLKHNILIRDCSNFDGLNEYYFRVAVKKRQDNEKLIEGLKNL